MSATTTGSVTLPRSPVTVTSCSPPGCASSMPSTDSYDARLTRATGLRAVARRCSSPSCIEPRSTSCFQVARAKAVSPFFGALTGFGGLPASSAGRAPSHGPRAWISSRTSATVRKPSGRPCPIAASSSAIPDSTRRSGSEDGLANTASKDRARASHVTKVPALSVTGATGRTTSATRVTSVSRSSRLTTKRAASSAARKAAGSAVSSGSTPPTTRPPRSPLRSAATIALPSRPTLAGSDSTPHAAARSTRAAASVTGRPPGSRLGSAPASTAPRSPARRGTQAMRAPVLAASCAAAVRAPWVRARRSPTRMTASLEMPCSASLSEPITSTSVPGTAGTSRPFIFVSPREA